MQLDKLTREQQSIEDEKRRMYKKATRVNKHQPAHYMPYKTPPELKNPAATASFNRLTDSATYRTGDGDTPIPARPGSLDFMKYPSKGIG